MKTTLMVPVRMRPDPRIERRDRTGILPGARRSSARRLACTAGYVLLFLGLAVSPTRLLGTSLVLSYSFDSIADGIVHDSSGNGLDGIVHGNLALAPGTVGQAARFGGDGYIELPKDPRLSLGAGSDMTWIAWIRRDDVLAGAYQRGIPQLQIFTKLDGVTGLQFMIANNSPSFYLPTSLGNQRHMEPVKPMGDWSQIVLIKQNADWWLYQDGQPLPAPDAHFGAPGMWGLGDAFPADGNLDPGAEFPMIIGASVSPVPGDFFKGWMDEIQIYDEALTPGDLKSLGIDITPGASLNSYTQLLGEAPDNLPAWPWDPQARRGGDVPDTGSTALAFGLASVFLLLGLHRSRFREV